MVKRSVELGLDPITALQIASLNAAQYFRIKDLGAIAPGYRADMVVLEDLESLRVQSVIKDGCVVAEGGELFIGLKSAPSLKSSSFNVQDLSLESFEIEAEPGLTRVIGIIPDQILTKSRLGEPKGEDGRVGAVLDRDILKLAGIERHRGTGNVGLGLVSGFGMKSGAIATSVAHDSHNLAVVGTKSEEMLAAALEVRSMGGGLAVVRGGEVLARLPLPVAGLLSDRYMYEVADGIDEAAAAARGLGCILKDPFMTLSFLCLPVIPELKLTDLGLVDVGKFDLVSLFVRDGA
jgi:adenine deaminase